MFYVQITFRLTADNTADDGSPLKDERHAMRSLHVRLAYIEGQPG